MARAGHSEAGCDEFLSQIREGFNNRIRNHGSVLFTTDATGLFDLFLKKLGSDVLRQHYNCNACRKFIETYGGLVTIDCFGNTYSAMWYFDAKGIYQAPVAALCSRVMHAPVTGVFLSKELIWGTPISGGWTHMAVSPPSSMIHRDLLLTPGQAMAGKLEDFRMLQRALEDFPASLVQKALPLLESESLYRSEKVLGVAKWFYDLHLAVAGHSGDVRNNLVWKAVATAPAGFCHIRTTMIGTLLEDLASGMPITTVASRFKFKMDPLQYQRPTAPPKAGNIDRANEIFDKLGLAPALERRYATVEDVKKHLLWQPKAKNPNSAGRHARTFDHLRNDHEDKAPDYVPTQAITWEKFARTVLPQAEAIYYKVPNFGSFVAMVTAGDPDAPPILQWDNEINRNPVSWYVYPNGSSASQWGLVPYEYVKVTGICLFPHQWNGGKFNNHPKGTIAILEGARDSRHTGLVLFPEVLKSELHSVRSVIEAHSNSKTLAGKDWPNLASGLDLRKWGQVLRVKTSSGFIDYKIDRWD